MRLLLQAEMVAPCLQIASLEGEAGTGKHLFARTLHQKSPFAATPFRRRDAREWLATETKLPPLDGTLYLDRIDLLTTTGQHLLLSFVKAIQSGFSAFPPFLLLTSSHVPLRQLANHGRFLPDLAFRLTAVRFSLPPLREHREDITPIARAILEEICHRYQQPIATLDPGALQLLIQHSWPGNVRELSSVLESALLDSVSGVITPAELNLAPPPQPQPPSATGPEPPAPMTLDAAIRRHIQLVLNLNHGNKLRAAKQLGISRSTLDRILAEQSLESPCSIFP
jgi:two-component system response regulator AtoC